MEDTESTEGEWKEIRENGRRMGNRRGISRGGAGTRREKNTKIVCLGLYSRGFASFAGQGGFAADLGRFGETTLPFYRLALTEQRPPVWFFSPPWLRVSFRPAVGSRVLSLPGAFAALREVLRGKQGNCNLRTKIRA